ncbi:MAG: NADP-dependent phosphogluconate dehydrogenase, partial [Burkholderiaceae bacterium]
LMEAAQKRYSWKLNFGEIAQIFRGGCIIRAGFLQKITEAYVANPGLKNLLLDRYFSQTVQSAQAQWRSVIALAVTHGVPVPTLGSALSYFDAYRSAVLPHNLLQGQRDYFGAHSYERTDAPRGKFFHLDWPVPGRPQREV